MSGTTATPPPATPAAPPAPTPPTAPTTPPPPSGAGVQIPSVDDDPNLAMSRLVSRSREKQGKPASTSPSKAENTPETPPPAAPQAPQPAPSDATETPQKLVDLVGKALKFTQKPASPTSPPSPQATEPAAPAATTEAPAPAEPAKKAAKGRKAAQPQADPAAIASAAATAATEVAVKALRQASTPAPAPAASPVEKLTEDDKRDYEIAEFLAQTDPRYKDAPKIILEHVNRAEDYAARWEAANPGKEFDASDTEHDEFFSKLSRPWSANEFRQAEIKLAVKKGQEEVLSKNNASIAELHQNQAHIELAPVVEKRFIETTVNLAKLVSDEVHDSLTKGGWEELHKQDPVTAQVMSATLDQMHPFIEAAIEIDDPKQRVRIDPNNNAAHSQWNQVVTTGESKLVGQVDENGRVFARRADYVRMSPSQRAQHWYLTTEMIIKGAVDYAAEQVKTVSESQKQRLAALGFVRQPKASGAQATQQVAAAVPSTPAPPVSKPVSPTAGSGTKIDDTGGAPTSKEAALMNQIHGILFKR